MANWSEREILQLIEVWGKREYRSSWKEPNGTSMSMSWRFFDAMDAILRHRPTTRPSVVLDTSENLEEGEELDDEGQDEASQEQSVMSSSLEEEDVQQAQSASSSSGSGLKGKKRKCTKEEKIEAALTRVVKEVINAPK